MVIFPLPPFPCKWAKLSHLSRSPAEAILFDWWKRTAVTAGVFFKQEAMREKGERAFMREDTCTGMFTLRVHSLETHKSFHNSGNWRTWYGRWNQPTQPTSLAKSQKALEAHGCKPWVANLSIVPDTLGILTANSTCCILLLEYDNKFQANMSALYNRGLLFLSHEGFTVTQLYQDATICLYDNVNLPH